MVTTEEENEKILLYEDIVFDVVDQVSNEFFIEETDRCELEDTLRMIGFEEIFSMAQNENFPHLLKDACDKIGRRESFPGVKASTSMGKALFDRYKKSEVSQSNTQSTTEDDDEKSLIHKGIVVDAVKEVAKDFLFEDEDRQELEDTLQMIGYDAVLSMAENDDFPRLLKKESDNIGRGELFPGAKVARNLGRTLSDRFKALETSSNEGSAHNTAVVAGDDSDDDETAFLEPSVALAKNICRAAVASNAVYQKDPLKWLRSEAGCLSHDLRECTVPSVASVPGCEENSLPVFVHFETATRESRQKLVRNMISKNPIHFFGNGSPVDDYTPIVVAFRGTNELPDVIEDFKIRGDPSFHGSTHGGFTKRANAYPLEWVLYQIKVLQRCVLFTGHGLGGPTAALVTARLLESLGGNSFFMNKIKCITFGSPLVGDQGFRSYMKSSKMDNHFLHVLSSADIIPYSLLVCESGRNLAHRVSKTSPQSELEKSVSNALKIAETSVIPPAASALALPFARKLVDAVTASTPNLLISYQPFGHFVVFDASSSQPLSEKNFLKLANDMNDTQSEIDFGEGTLRAQFMNCIKQKKKLSLAHHQMDSYMRLASQSGLLKLGELLEIISSEGVTVLTQAFCGVNSCDNISFDFPTSQPAAAAEDTDHSGMQIQEYDVRNPPDVKNARMYVTDSFYVVRLVLDSTDFVRSVQLMIGTIEFKPAVVKIQNKHSLLFHIQKEEVQLEMRDRTLNVSFKIYTNFIPNPQVSGPIDLKCLDAPSLNNIIERRVSSLSPSQVVQAALILAVLTDEQCDALSKPFVTYNMEIEHSAFRESVTRIRKAISKAHDKAQSQQCEWSSIPGMDSDKQFEMWDEKVKDAISSIVNSSKIWQRIIAEALQDDRAVLESGVALSNEVKKIEFYRGKVVRALRIGKMVDSAVGLIVLGGLVAGAMATVGGGVGAGLALLEVTGVEVAGFAASHALQFGVLKWIGNQWIQSIATYDECLNFIDALTYKHNDDTMDDFGSKEHKVAQKIRARANDHKENCDGGKNKKTGDFVNVENDLTVFKQKADSLSKKDWKYLLPSAQYVLCESSYKPVLNMLRSVALVDELREVLSRWKCLGIVGLKNSGKSTLVRSLCEGKVVVGPSVADSTFMVRRYNLKRCAGDAHVFDFPGYDDILDSSMVNTLCMSQCFAVIVVCNFSQLQIKKIKALVEKAVEHGRPVILCANQCDDHLQKIAQEGRDVTKQGSQLLKRDMMKAQDSWKTEGNPNFEIVPTILFEGFDGTRNLTASQAWEAGAKSVRYIQLWIARQYLRCGHDEVPKALFSSGVSLPFSSVMNQFLNDIVAEFDKDQKPSWFLTNGSDFVSHPDSDSVSEILTPVYQKLGLEPPSFVSVDSTVFGSCHALSHALFGTPHEGQALQLLAVEWLRKNSPHDDSTSLEQYRELFELPLEKRFSSKWSEYILSLETYVHAGDELCLVALAEVLDIRIVLLELGEGGDVRGESLHSTGATFGSRQSLSQFLIIRVTPHLYHGVNM